MPFTRVEVVVLTVVEGVLMVLLARRSEEPCAGAWALPGGVLRIDLDSSLDEAAYRIIRERLGTLARPFLRQQCATGGPDRDPRAPWTLAIAYRALVVGADFLVNPGKRIEELAWRPASEAAQDGKLAFDHAVLIGQAVVETRAEVERLKLPREFLPEAFSLGELQALCETLTGRRLDKSSFRRRLREADVLEPVSGAMRTGAFRPAQLYRLREIRE